MLKNIKSFILGLVVVTVFLVTIPLYISFENSVETSLIQEAKNTSNVIGELRTLYTTEVIGNVNGSCAPAMSIYGEVEGAIPLPATLSIMLGERLSEGKFEGQVKLYSKYPFPWRKETGGLRDNFAKNAWRFLNEYPDSSYYEVQDINGEDVIRYATGDRLKKGCVNCHNTYVGTPKKDWKINDLRGVLEIQKPSQVIKAKVRDNYLFSGLTIIGGSLLLIFFIYQGLINLKNENLKTGRLNHELTDLKIAFDETAIVARTNLKGEITYVNKKFCEISKYSKEELLGQDHRILNSGFHSKEFFKDLWRTIGNGKVWRGTVKNKAKDGSFYWVDSTMIPIRNQEGKVYQYVAIRFDVTKSKEATEKVKIHNKDLENFAHIISHDLKAPLRGINTLADFIEDDLGEDIDEEVKTNFGLLKGRIKRMNNLINGVLDFSKHSLNIDDEKGQEIVDLKELISEIVSDSVTDKRAQIIVDENLPALAINRVKAHQVFGNLIWNAVKYNDKENPEITVGFKQEEGKTVFFVKDNGPGISKDYQEKIFIIFQTLHARDDIESTGVGLSIVKKIINQYGGEIWIDSDGKNGSTFYFTFE